MTKIGRPPGAAPLPPSPWVERFICGVPARAPVLDLACGGGRHTRLALACGHGVTALDRDTGNLGDLVRDPRVEVIAADLETGAPFPLGARVFGGVIVTNYLWRPILPAIVAAVGPAGILIYETFAVGHERLGRPSNPDFLLKAGELLAAVGPRLVVIAFEHATLNRGRPRVVQRIAAVALDHPWVMAPPSAALA